jgi:hypothetical protein
MKRGSYFVVSLFCSRGHFTVSVVLAHHKRDLGIQWTYKYWLVASVHYIFFSISPYFCFLKTKSITRGFFYPPAIMAGSEPGPDTLGVLVTKNTATIASYKTGI